MSDDVVRGTSPPPGGLAATALADWRTVAEAAAEIGCSKRTIERLAASRKVESRLRPTAGSPAVAVYNPDDVRRLALERRPDPAPWIVPAGPPPTNGNGHHPTAELTNSSLLNIRGEDPIREIAAAFKRFLLSPPSPPVAESVAESQTLYVDVEEGAAILNWTLRDLRRAIRAGDLAARFKERRDWRTWRIRRKDLEAL